MREVLKLKILIPVVILTVLSLSVRWKQYTPTIPPTSPLLTTETAPATNWKTYRSKNRHYEIRYPSNFYLQEYAADVISISNYDMKASGYDMGGDSQIASEKQGILMVSIVTYTFKDASAEDYLNKWEKNFKNTGAQPFPPSIIGSVIIDGVKFIKTLDYSYGLDKDTSYYAARNGKLHKITYHFKSKEPEPELEYAFDQILSTFKFID